MKGTISAVAVLSIALTLVGSASAADFHVTATRTAVMADPDGLARVLLAFPGLSELREEWVSDATLTIPLGVGTLASDVGITVDALTSNWSGSPEWSSPWRTPGGDALGKMPSDVVIRAGGAERSLRVDVTDLVRAQADGTIQDYGFILLPTDGAKVGFSESEAAVLGAALSGATLDLHYRKLTGLGYRGGAQAMAERKRTARAESSTR